MKKIINALLKSQIGKIIVTALIMEFMQYIEKEFSINLFPLDDKTKEVIVGRFVNDKLK